MTKFQDMTYQRPDFDGLYAQMEALLSTMRTAQEETVFFTAYEQLDTLSRTLFTMSSLCNVRHTIDTRDAFYDAERNVFDEESPRFSGLSTELSEVILASPFKDEVAKRYGKHLLEKLEVQRKTFKPEILEDLVEENKLASEYQKLIASAQIEFDGQTYNLSGLIPLMRDLDRENRRRSNDAFWGWMAGQMEKLDGIYDQLVKVRHRIALKLGYENFIPVAYARMGRTDWDTKDAAIYRNQILQDVVPFAQRLYREQAERLQISPMKHYDYALEYTGGNPKPQGEEKHLVEAAVQMYDELSPETGAFFRMMVACELMDLTTKPGKAGGGYMTSFPDYQVPFIFSNFNGTSGDVDVLTHEAGHAFQGWLQRDVRPSALNDFTMEVAEIHSMSMEFFTHPWMENFFGADTEKYYDSHVADAIKFLPYGASIDEFQEWVYQNPAASPKARRAQYRLIEKKYRPHLEYDGLTYLEEGGFWQKQGHLFSMPFYYLDYTIAQVCAFQYFVWDMQNHEEAWQSYLKVCHRAGVVPFKELIRECGLESPFEEGTIARLIPKLEAYMKGLDKSKMN